MAPTEDVGSDSDGFPDWETLTRAAGNPYFRDWTAEQGPPSSSGFLEPFITDEQYAKRATAGQPPRAALALCEEYLQRENITKFISIDQRKVTALADEIQDELFKEVEAMAKADEGGLCVQPSPAAGPESDENKESPEHNPEPALCQIARILVYNVMNFSFYPDDGKPPWFIQVDGKVVGEDDEAFAIVESLKRWERSGHYESWLKEKKNQGRQPKEPICWTDGRYLKSFSLPTLASLFAPAPGSGELPLLEMRLKCLHSLAKGMYFSGDSHLGATGLSDFLGAKSGTTDLTSAPPMPVGRFVAELCERVPAFRDLRHGIEFAKRPQLTVGLLHRGKLVEFSDIENLTVFSDYRLPQLFRTRKAFTLRLPECDDDGMTGALQLRAPSAAETALRAATLVIAERIREELNARRGDGEEPILPGDLDYFLWKKTIQLDGEGVLKPFHRTRTFAY